MHRRLNNKGVLKASAPVNPKLEHWAAAEVRCQLDLSPFDAMVFRSSEDGISRGFFDAMRCVQSEAIIYHIYTSLHPKHITFPSPVSSIAPREEKNPPSCRRIRSRCGRTSRRMWPGCKLRARGRQVNILHGRAQLSDNTDSVEGPVHQGRRELWAVSVGCSY